MGKTLGYQKTKIKSRELIDELIKLGKHDQLQIIHAVDVAFGGSELYVKKYINRCVDLGLVEETKTGILKPKGVTNE